MKFLLTAALVCFCIGLAISLGAGEVLDAASISWGLGGFIAATLALLIGPWIDRAVARSKS